MAIGNPTPAHGRALLALPLVLLAACGGGGAAPNPPTGQGGPAPVRAGGGSGSNLQTAPCFRTFDGDCLSNGEFTSRSRSLAGDFKARREQTVNRDFGTISPQALESFLWPLERINLDKARAHLSLAKGSRAANAPGRGVTIGFLDSGIRKQHKAFEQNSFVREDFFLSAVNESSNEFSHGTAVASVAAGKYGVAYGAGVKMFAIPLSDPPDPNDPYNPITLNQLSTDDFQFAQLSEQILGQGIDILNLSVALRGGIEDYGEQDLRNNYGRTIQALAQSGKQDKTILVWAAGNDGKKPEASPSSPAITAGLPARIEELQGHSIAVVSIGQDGDISDFSNRCGIARDFCIAAPGEGVRVAATNSGDSFWGVGSGTSYAAPMVSGSLAVMKQLFRGQLSNEELVSRLFATADKQGIYGNQAIYGQGLLDLGAATNPWGTPGFMRTGSTTSGSGAAPITTTSLTAGPALGDSLSQALDSREVATFDSLGAPFWLDAGAFTGEGPGVTVAARLQEALHPLHRQPIPETWRFHLQGNATAHPYGHLALAHGASRLTVAGPQGVSASLFQAPERLQGMALSWHPPSIPALSFTAGHLQEHGTLLGSHANGAFGRFSAATTFLGATLNTTAGRWKLSAAGEIGAVQPSLAASSLIDHVSPLTTSAFRLQASKIFDNGHGLSLSLAQPLRVDQGAASFSLPTGRTGDGVVTGASFSSPLAPSGRQLDLTTTVEMPLAGGDLYLGVTGSFQPRHQQSASAEWIFFTGYRTTW